MDGCVCMWVRVCVREAAANMVDIWTLAVSRMIETAAPCPLRPSAAAMTRVEENTVEVEAVNVGCRAQRPDRF